ncbi:MAG TPA: hypothetical protein VHD87_13025 [Acidimicrobiales bacterium]|nr:hypothetical protein [Acidimicrobiales bacterium]
MTFFFYLGWLGGPFGVGLLAALLAQADTFACTELFLASVTMAMLSLLFESYSRPDIDFPWMASFLLGGGAAAALGAAASHYAAAHLAAVAAVGFVTPFCFAAFAICITPRLELALNLYRVRAKQAVALTVVHALMAVTRGVALIGVRAIKLRDELRG